MIVRILTAVSLALVAGCGIPEPLPQPSSVVAPVHAQATEVPVAPNDPKTYALSIPISPELKANGGVVALIRLPNDGALVHEKIVVEPSSDVLTVTATDRESVAVTQSSDDVVRSITLRQPGCGGAVDSTGVVLRVPDDFSTIQAAIDSARPGDTVLVRPGTWTEHLQMRPGVRLRGSGAAQTILDGQGQPRNLIDLTAAPGVVISGFTFRGVPRADIGCSQPDEPFVCSGDWFAAAIFGDGYWEWYQDYVVGHAELNAEMDAPACSGAFAFVTQNVFEQNFIAVMPYFHTRLIVSNNIFRDNAFAFAANHLQDRGALLNNVFWNNDAIAVGIQAGYVDVINNVIAASGTGYQQEYIQQGLLACNFFWQNATDLAPEYPGAPPRITFGTDGNAKVDPLFVDAGNGHFHLASGSPAVDTGCTAFSISDPDGSAVDIGAYGGPFGRW